MMHIRFLTSNDDDRQGILGLSNPKKIIASWLPFGSSELAFASGVVGATQDQRVLSSRRITAMPMGYPRNSVQIISC